MKLEQCVARQQPPQGGLYKDTAERIKKYCSRLWASINNRLSPGYCVQHEFANLTTNIIVLNFYSSVQI